MLTFNGANELATEINFLEQCFRKVVGYTEFSDRHRHQKK